MIHYSDLTHEDIKKISDGCGIVAKGLKVPDFIFTASCDRHDVYWCRGTGWNWNETYLRYGTFGILLMPYSLLRWYIQGVYWLWWANVWFYRYMLKDAWNPVYSWLETIIYTFLATVYFIAVSCVALIPRTNAMCRWRTKEGIIAYALEDK